MDGAQSLWRRWGRVSPLPGLRFCRRVDSTAVRGAEVSPWALGLEGRGVPSTIEAPAMAQSASMARAGCPRRVGGRAASSAVSCPGSQLPAAGNPETAGGEPQLPSQVSHGSLCLAALPWGVHPRVGSPPCGHPMPYTHPDRMT